MPTLTRRGTITYLLMLALASPVWGQAPAGAQKAPATETFTPAQTPAPPAAAPAPPAPQPATTTPAEDTVVVRMIDAIDSSRDAQGKEYRAVVTRDASAGLMAIPKGSPAKIVLVRTASGWLTQLIAVNIYGSEAEVTSHSATVNGLVPGAAGGVVGVATGLLGGFGRKKASAPTNPVVSGKQVNLIPGTEVQFTLGPPQVPIAPRRTSAPPQVPAAPGTTRTRSGSELAK